MLDASDSNTDATEGDSNPETTPQKVERTNPKRVAPSADSGTSKHGSVKDFFTKPPRNNATVFIKSPPVKPDKESNQPRRAKADKGEVGPRNGRSGTSDLLPRLSESSDRLVDESVTSERLVDESDESLISKSGGEVELVDGGIIEDGIWFPPPPRIYITRDTVIVNRVTKRKFRVLRKYKPTDPDDDTFSETMWILVILGGEEDEVIVSEKNLLNKTMYRIIDGDDYDDVGPGHKVYLPRDYVIDE